MISEYYRITGAAIGAEAGPGESTETLHYAIMRGSYPGTQWWTGNDWRATHNKTGRIAWYKTKADAQKALVWISAQDRLGPMVQS
jgi:hypothetical protein